MESCVDIVSNSSEFLDETVPSSSDNWSRSLFRNLSLVRAPCFGLNFRTNVNSSGASVVSPCSPATISPTVCFSVVSGRSLASFTVTTSTVRGVFDIGSFVVASDIVSELDVGRIDNLDIRDPSNLFRVGAVSRSNGLIIGVKGDF